MSRPVTPFQEIYAQVKKRLLRAALEERGFKKHRTGIFTLPAGGGIVGWLGLPHEWVAPSQVLVVAPKIGLRHQLGEVLMAIVKDYKKPSVHTPPSCCTNVGYLRPEHRYLEWYFQVGGDLEAAVAEAMVDIDEYALPFVRANASLEGLVERMVEGVCDDMDQRGLRLPLFYALLGEDARAEAALEERAKQFQGDRDFDREVREEIGRLREVLRRLREVAPPEREAFARAHVEEVLGKGVRRYLKA